jgi:hypothetical protein
MSEIILRFCQEVVQRWMVEEMKEWKRLKGNCHDLIQALCQHFPGPAESFY